MATAKTDTIKEAAKKVEDFAADTQKAMTEQMEKLSKGVESATSFSQENVDAIVKSSEITAKAFEGINAEVVSYSKKSFDDGVAAAKDLAASKNVAEVMEKQTEFAKASVESFMKQATKLNELYTNAAKSAVEPLGARVQAATDAFKGFSA